MENIDLEKLIKASEEINLCPELKIIMPALEDLSVNKKIEELSLIFGALKHNNQVNSYFLKNILSQISNNYYDNNVSFGEYLQNSMDIIQIISGNVNESSEIKFWRFYKTRSENKKNEDRSIFTIRALKKGFNYFRDVDDTSTDKVLRNMINAKPVILNELSEPSNYGRDMYVPINILVGNVPEFLGVIEINNKKTFSSKDLIVTDYFCSNNFSREYSRYFSEWHDELTGVYTRKALNDLLMNESRRCIKSKGNMSVILADIDNFKKVNDTRGHWIGDKVLYNFSKTIYEHTRPLDKIARYGGEEFLIILPGTEIEEAHDIANRVRRAVEENIILVDDEPVCITSSFGVNQLNYTHLSKFIDHPSALKVISKDLIIPADKQLYRAKQTGRNRVCSDLN